MHPPSPALPILYQDEWLVAVDKPPGQLVHPADVPQDGDQVTMKILRDQIGVQVYNIHRIDRPTTGVLLFGICRDAARCLHRALEDHWVKKTYLAVVQGTPTAQTWECYEPSQKHDNAPVREAHTSFRCLASTHPTSLQTETPSSISLIEARPHTGRFHQIRRHLLHVGHPIIGDYRYAGIETSNILGSLLGTGTRMLLQSKSLTFTHPVTQKTIHIEAPLERSLRMCFPKQA